MNLSVNHRHEFTQTRDGLVEHFIPGLLDQIDRRMPILKTLHIPTESENLAFADLFTSLLPCLAHCPEDAAEGAAVTGAFALLCNAPVLRLRDLRRANALLLMKQPNGKSSLRNVTACAGASNPEHALYVAPPATHVASLTEDALKFLRASPLPRLAKGWITLLQLLLVHPFRDGNGRTARVAFAAFLYRSGLPDIYALLGLIRMYKHNGWTLHGISNQFRQDEDWQPYLAFCVNCHAFARKRFPCNSGEYPRLSNLEPYEIVELIRT